MDADTLQALISEVRTEKESPDPYHVLSSMTRAELNLIIAWLTIRQHAAAGPSCPGGGAP